MSPKSIKKQNNLKDFFVPRARVKGHSTLSVLLLYFVDDFVKM